MNPQHEHLNDELERLNAGPQNGRASLNGTRSPLHASVHDQEVDELLVLAHRLQTAPPLQVDPDFARQLETRILLHNVSAVRKPSARTGWGWLFPGLFRSRPSFKLALSMCLLLLLLGTGVLLVSARISNPNSPLYAVKRLELNALVSLTGSAADRAELDFQFARERLSSLGDLANAAHSESYLQGLMELNQEVNSAAQSISAVSAGPQHNHLFSELSGFKLEARHTLRRFLLQLALPERLATTTELGRLGDQVSLLKSAEIILSAPSSTQATINITGNNLQPKANLLVNDQVVNSRGYLLGGQIITSDSFVENGAYLFMTNWNGSHTPHSIGILNPDGTVAQTTDFTLQISGISSNGQGQDNPSQSQNSGNGNGEGTGNGFGNGNGSGGDGIVKENGRILLATAVATALLTWKRPEV